MSVNLRSVDSFYGDRVYEGLPIIAEGSVTSDKYNIKAVSYKWTLYEIDKNFKRLNPVTQTGKSFQFTPEGGKNYLLSLSITDDNGLVKTFDYFPNIFEQESIKPVIKLSGEHFVLLGETVNLDASDSIQSERLGVKRVNSFDWRIVETPPNSSLGQLTNNTQSFSFTPDISGRYKLNLVIANEDFSSNKETLLVYVNKSKLYQGQKTFLNIRRENFGIDLNHPFIGDFDGNGMNDILVVTHSNNSNDFNIYLSFFLQDVNHTFRALMPIGLPYDSLADIDILTNLDFTGNGKSEILLSNKGRYELYKLEANDTIKLIGTATPPSFINLPVPLFADINGDNKTDIVWKSSASNVLRTSLYIALQRDFQTDILDSVSELVLPERRTISQLETRSVPGSMWNSTTQRDDVYIVSYLEPDSENKGENTMLLHFAYDDISRTLKLGEQTKIKVTPENFWNTLIPIDLNKDGKLDIIDTRKDLTAYFSVKSNNMKTRQILDKFSNDIYDSEDVTVLDLNNDGLKDIVSGNFVFIQGNNFSFNRAQHLPATNNNRTFGDFNNDGILDSVSTYLNESIKIEYSVSSQTPQ